MQRLIKWHRGCFCKDSLNWRRVGVPAISVCKLSGCCGDCHCADVDSARSGWSGVVILHTSPYMSPSWSIAFSPTGAYHRDQNTSLEIDKPYVYPFQEQILNSIWYRIYNVNICPPQKLHPNREKRPLPKMECLSARLASHLQCHHIKREAGSHLKKQTIVKGKSNSSETTAVFCNIKE